MALMRAFGLVRKPFETSGATNRLPFAHLAFTTPSVAITSSNSRPSKRAETSSTVIGASVTSPSELGAISTGPVPKGTKPRSTGFATPLGYQTHLMVYGVGGYRFSDYIRIGVPLDIVVMVVAVTFTLLFFPLR